MYGSFCLFQIGTFSSDGVLDLDMDLVPKYDGSCERKDSCVECPTIRNRGVRYAVGGDLNANITLVGVFDIHNRGTELYQCGSLNMEGFLQFLAFFRTYSQVRGLWGAWQSAHQQSLMGNWGKRLVGCLAVSTSAIPYGKLG